VSEAIVKSILIKMRTLANVNNVAVNSRLNAKKWCYTSLGKHLTFQDEHPPKEKVFFSLLYLAQ
jgi:hypothetical protein